MDVDNKNDTKSPKDEEEENQPDGGEPKEKVHEQIDEVMRASLLQKAMFI